MTDIPGSDSSWQIMDKYSERSTTATATGTSLNKIIHEQTIAVHVRYIILGTFICLSLQDNNVK